MSPVQYPPEWPGFIVEKIDPTDPTPGVRIGAIVEMIEVDARAARNNGAPGQIGCRVLDEADLLREVNRHPADGYPGLGLFHGYLRPLTPAAQEAHAVAAVEWQKFMDSKP